MLPTAVKAPASPPRTGRVALGAPGPLWWPGFTVPSGKVLTTTGEREASDVSSRPDHEGQERAHIRAEMSLREDTAGRGQPWAGVLLRTVSSEDVSWWHRDQGTCTHLGGQAPHFACGFHQGRKVASTGGLSWTAGGRLGLRSPTRRAGACHRWAPWEATRKGGGRAPEPALWAEDRSSCQASSLDSSPLSGRHAASLPLFRWCRRGLRLRAGCSRKSAGRIVGLRVDLWP